MKKTLNILMVVAAVITFALSVFFFVSFCKCAVCSDKSTLSVYDHQSFKIIYYIMPLTKLIIFDFFVFFLLLAVTALFVFLLVYLNRNELKSVSIDFKSRREEKQRLKDKAKKEKLQKELDELNKKDSE